MTAISAACEGVAARASAAKVGQCEIRLMPDSVDDRSRRRDGAHHRLLIERQWGPIEPPPRSPRSEDPPDDGDGRNRSHARFPCGLLSLHGHRIQDEPTPLFRRRDTVMISCTAAPEGDVMIPIARGRRGSGFFSETYQKPFLRELLFSAHTPASDPRPLPAHRIHIELVHRPFHRPRSSRAPRPSPRSAD